jgi:hypothetical protein
MNNIELLATYGPLVTTIVITIGLIVAVSLLLTKG